MNTRDILITYSTTQEQNNVTTEVNISNFSEVLCKEIENKSGDIDLFQVLTKVNGILTKDRNQYMKIINGLTKKICFLPNKPADKEFLGSIGIAVDEFQKFSDQKTYLQGESSKSIKKDCSDEEDQEEIIATFNKTKHKKIEDNPKFVKSVDDQSVQLEPIEDVSFNLPPLGSFPV